MLSFHPPDFCTKFRSQPKNPNAFRDFECFVNYSLFSFRDAEKQQIDETELFRREMQRRFWDQIERLAPESYVADGLHFIFVTKNPQVYEIFKDWVTAEGGG